MSSTPRAAFASADATPLIPVALLTGPAKEQGRWSDFANLFFRVPGSFPGVHVVDPSDLFHARILSCGTWSIRVEYISTLSAFSVIRSSPAVTTISEDAGNGDGDGKGAEDHYSYNQGRRDWQGWRRGLIAWLGGHGSRLGNVGDVGAEFVL